jgi:uncharacterized protein YgbK (DUF1537 family)
LCLAAVVFPAGTALGQTDDFEDGNDSGWTRYDPIGSHPQLPDIATFSAAGKAYRIKTSPSPLPATVGPARAGGIRNWALWLGGSSSELTVMPPAGRWLVVCGSRHPVSRAQAQTAAALGFDMIATPLEDSPLGAAEAQWFATAAADTQARAMMIFGGDTVLAVCRKLGIESLTPLGEVLPGVAVSCSGSRVFVTKAGGYGEPDLVERVVERWRT